jgi:hypothetical protein
MERYIKPVFCTSLNKNFKVTYYIHDVKLVNGDFKLKAVDYYKCEGKKHCGNDIVLDCTCLRELPKVEWEINRNS